MENIQIYRVSKIVDNDIDILVASLQLQHSAPYSHSKVREVSFLYAYEPVNYVALPDRYRSLEHRHSISRYVDAYMHTMLYTSDDKTICGIAHPPFLYEIGNHICCMCIGHTVDSVSQEDVQVAFKLLQKDAVATLDSIYDISADDSPVEYVIPYLIPNIDNAFQIELMHELFKDLNVKFHIFQLNQPDM